MTSEEVRAGYRQRAEQAAARAAELAALRDRLDSDSHLTAEDLEDACDAVSEATRHSAEAHDRAAAAYARAAQVHRRAAEAADLVGDADRAVQHRAAADADDEAGRKHER